MSGIHPKYDDIQRRVIAIDRGSNLVLAPAGCGKTGILAERVAHALSAGVDVADMLCLTFTNRAARGMQRRIKSRAGVDASGLFVGNTHRFCAKFLYDNNVVGQSTAILDEEDSFSVINTLGDCVTSRPDALFAELSFAERNRFGAVLKLGFLIKQYRAGHPRHLWLYREASYKDRNHTEYLFSPRKFDILCKDMGVPVSIGSIIHIYENIDTSIDTREYGYESRELLRLMKTARDYERYKIDFGVMDFDDLLFLTYEYAINNPDSIHKYSWIQIDEVQDLNPLQFAIVDAFTARDHVTVYLGDEQQAIFSFLGAKLSTLDWLKKRCGSNILHLEKCYRSPKYLLDFLNDYANLVLETDPDFLPVPSNDDTPLPGDMLLVDCYMNNGQNGAVVQLAKRFKDGRTAILVNSNDRADAIGRTLDTAALPHFKISGADIFTLPATKMVLDHLNVVNSDLDFLAWARLTSRMKLDMSYPQARDFVRQLRDVGIVMSDFIERPDSSYLLDFMHDYLHKPIIIFDTETTGLNVFEDEIVQIAATKYIGRTPVSTLNVILHTDREIPPMLGDTVNPLVEEYATRRHLDRAAGLREFVEYARGCVLLGHNVNYDFQILCENCRRVLPDIDIPSLFPVVYDTLKLARIICPSLKSYKLKDLLTSLGLEGSNSHLADDDIFATGSLADFCFDRAVELAPGIRENLCRSAGFAEKFRDAYGNIYCQAKSALNVKKHDGLPALTAEMRKVYGEFVAKKFCQPIDKFQYICRFLEKEVIDYDICPTLGAQLANHVIDLNTYREADLCDSKVVEETIFVSTVHKAKGLEFDNVIVCDCVDGVYPFFANQDSPEESNEDARKLYVALSRSKHRLALLTYTKKQVSNGLQTWTFDVETSPFLSKILPRHPFANVNVDKHE